MKMTKLVLLLTLAFALALIALQNQAPLEVHFLWLTGEVPGVVLLFLTAVAGFIMGVTAALLVKDRTKPKRAKGRGMREKEPSAQETGTRPDG